MIKYFLLLFIAFSLFSCEKSDLADDVANSIVDDEASVRFENLLMLISLRAPDSNYIVVESIDSLRLYINNRFWSVSSSEILDTATVSKTDTGQWFETGTKLNYLFVAPQQQAEADLGTAGGVADYLNSKYELQTGEYVCMLESFCLKLNNGTMKRYYPYKYVVFELGANTKNTFVGEIEIEVY